MAEMVAVGGTLCCVPIQTCAPFWTITTNASLLPKMDSLEGHPTRLGVVVKTWFWMCRWERWCFQKKVESRLVTWLKQARSWWLRLVVPLGLAISTLPCLGARPLTLRNGGPGESKILRLELKLLADVGLVGLPNAGKSTLINGISAAKAKVADYPFTTLVPNLGVVAIGDQSFVVADMPGLIKGAADGVGLGLQFLRHCERTSTLVHLVDVSATEDPLVDMAIIREELANYGKELDTRPWILVASKVDMPDVKQNVETLRAEAKACGVPFVAISTFTGEGVKELVSMMARSALDPDSRV